MKTLKFESVLNLIGVLLLITVVTLVVINVSLYGVSSGASFEF
jgi:hypothetical protein